MGGILSDLRGAVVRTGLKILHWSGLPQGLQRWLAGSGAIFTLHHVRPASDAAFQPNRFLEITPGFLDHTIVALRQQGFSFVSIDEVHRRLQSGDCAERCVCLTFDDGYRDNLVHAYPVLRAHGVPFTIYVTTSFIDGTGELWWRVLEKVVAERDEIEATLDGTKQVFDCSSTTKRKSTFKTIYHWLRRRESEEELREAVRALAQRYDIDTAAICRDLCMTWDELRGLAADPLVTIGAHTVRHPILSKVSAADVRSELVDSASVLERRLGRRPRHFAYPFGESVSAGPREYAIAAEAGFDTAVTTRPGVLFPEHRHHLTALPRFTMTGTKQEVCHLAVMLSGLPTAVTNGFRRVNVA